MSHPSVTVIIPTYNEGQNIGAVVAAVRAVGPDFQVLVIDDGSSDDTAEAARAAGAEVYRHPYNIGNGAAIKSGIRNAAGKILVFMDGDGQHDPNDIPRLLEHLPAYDLVVGARSFKDQASLGRALGNAVYNRFAGYVAKFPIQDLTSGFRAVKASVARSLIHLLPNTYSYPTTMTLAVLRSGLSLRYVPIRTRKRQAGKSSISLFKDGGAFFHDHYPHLYPFFTFQGLFTGELRHVYDRPVLVSVHFHHPESFHQHECPALYHRGDHFYDRHGLRADLPDALRASRAAARRPD